MTSSENCPYCGNTITHDELDAIKAKIKSDFDEEMKIRRVALEKEIEEKSKVELVAERLKIESAARADLKEANKTISSLSDQVLQLTNSLKVTKSNLESELQKQRVSDRKDHETEKKAALLDQRAVFEKDKVQALAEVNATHQKEKATMEATLKSLQDKLKESENSSVGDGAEVNVYNELKSSFADDTIDVFEKDKRSFIALGVFIGDDCCGRILFEVRNKRWRDAYADKLGEEQVATESEYAVLVSSQFPSGHRDLLIRKDVIVVHPARTVYIAKILRKVLIELYRSSASEQDRATKTQLLYDFIRSPQFANRIAQAEKQIDELFKLEEKAKKEFDNVARKRGVALTELKNQIRDIDVDLNRIIGQDSDDTDELVEQSGHCDDSSFEEPQLW